MKLATAKELIRQWGFFRFLYDCAMSRARPWLMLCQVELRSLHPDPELPELPEGFEIRVATTAELIEAATDPVNDLNADWVRKAHQRGDICMAAFDGDQIACYVWRAFSPAPFEKGLWVHFSPEYPYSYKAYTRPDYRRRRLQHYASLSMERWMLERGYTHIISYIETHNYPSLTSSKKRGNRRVGLAGYLRLFGRTLPFRSPGARRHGFAFRSSAEPANGNRLRAPAN
jgi:hypothetical protein